MLSEGDQVRLRLFARYAANLRLYHPPADNLFICPICVDAFQESDVLSSQIRLDIGHAFPRELGGKLRTLECRKCNGALNAAADNELIRYHKQWDAMTNPAAVPTAGYMLMPSGRVNIDISSRGIHAHFSKSNPVAFKEATEALQNHTPFKLELPGFDRSRINLAVVHCAHLMWFREFGYRYLFTMGGQHVRRLLNGAERLDDGTFITMQISAGTVPPALLFRIGICTFPDRIRCLFACIPDPDPMYECQLVLLPGLNREDVNQFATVLSRANSWMNAEFRTIDGGPARRLAAPEYRNCLEHLWNGWQHHNIDMTKLMQAIYAEAGGSIIRRIDAQPIALRFGIRRESLVEYMSCLVNGGFLERAPRNQRLFLVKMTSKGRDGVVANGRLESRG